MEKTSVVLMEQGIIESSCKSIYNHMKYTTKYFLGPSAKSQGPFRVSRVVVVVKISNNYSPNHIIIKKSLSSYIIAK